jgi:hypothetical protein
MAKEKSLTAVQERKRASAKHKVAEKKYKTLCGNGKA